MNWKRSFSLNTVTPCVACPESNWGGFAGVDQIGFGGEEKAESSVLLTRTMTACTIHTIFAIIDNPRAQVPIGDKLVLHTMTEATRRHVPFSFRRQRLDGVRMVHPKPWSAKLVPENSIRTGRSSHHQWNSQVSTDGFI